MGWPPKKILSNLKISPWQSLLLVKMTAVISFIHKTDFWFFYFLRLHCFGTYMLTNKITSFERYDVYNKLKFGEKRKNNVFAWYK